MPPSPTPAPPGATPPIEITLRAQPAGRAWRAEVHVDGQQLHFGSLLTLIAWLARLGSGGGGIR